MKRTRDSRDYVLIFSDDKGDDDGDDVMCLSLNYVVKMKMCILWMVVEENFVMNYFVGVWGGSVASFFRNRDFFERLRVVSGNKRMKGVFVVKWFKGGFRNEFKCKVEKCLLYMEEEGLRIFCWSKEEEDFFMKYLKKSGY